MNTIVAARFGSVKPSPSLAAKARVDALRASGKTIVDFTLGEPDFPTPGHIVEAGVQALRHGETRYTNSAGTPALRAAIARKLLSENGLAYSAAQIVVGCGAKHIIYDAFSVSLEAGDEVVIPAPYWVSYPDMVAINGGVPVIVACPASAGFKLAPEQLEAAITPRTRWLVLNTPNNPTGAVYDRKELVALAEVLRRHPQVWIMTDEIYENFLYGTVKHYSLATLAPDLIDRILLINGMSKSYAMTGWRIGYGAGPEPLIKAINLLISQSTSCPSAVGQAAAIEALSASQQCVHDAVQEFQVRRDLIVSMLNAIPGVVCPEPGGAFYVFPSVEALLGKTTPPGKKLGDDVDVMNFLLEDAGVATVDGSSYGAPGYLRFSFATSTDNIRDGCHRIANAVSTLS